MKGIEKKKHEHIIHCLEELYLHTTEPDEGKRIEEDIAALSDIYEWYDTLLEGIHKESERYHSLYPEIQRRAYKQLRRVRYEQKKLE